MWIIDDDEGDQTIAHALIEAERVSLQPRFFAHAGEAVQALGQPGVCLPSLVLCDLSMPVMDGFQFLEWRRRSAFRSLPVVVRSISASQADIDRAYDLGANAYMVKPVLLEEAAAQFKAIRSYWLECCRLLPRDYRGAKELLSTPGLKRIAAVLSTAFSSLELESLETDPLFTSALRDASGSTEEAALLIKLGSAILTARDRGERWSSGPPGPSF